MKVDVNKLAKFIKVATINENVENCILRFESDGAKIGVMATDNISAAVSTMNKERFEDYKECIIPIKDVSKFIKLLDLFSGKINLEVDKSILLISGAVNDTHEKKLSYNLAAIEYCKNDLGERKIPSNFDAGFDINIDIFKNSLASYKTLGAEEVEIETNNNLFYVNVGDKHFDKISETIKVEYPNAKVKMNSVFAKVVPILDSKVNIAFKTGYPVRFKMKNDDYESCLIVAPKVEEE